jgi:hypothetical protein
MVSDFFTSHSHKTTRSVFPLLFKRLGPGDKDILPKARLAAVSALKQTHTVEYILELTLGPVTDGKLAVRFRGERRRVYANAAPTVIEFEGVCSLVPSRT